MPASSDQVFDIAEKLFFERGYKNVTLQAIASAMGMKTPSLYNHAPSGKEELFMRVVERCMLKHKTNLLRLIDENLKQGGIEETLVQTAIWMLNQPPVHFSRMLGSDLPLLSSENSALIRRQLDSCIGEPIRSIFEDAEHQGLTRENIFMTAGMYLGLVESLHNARLYNSRPQEEIVRSAVHLFLYGAIREQVKG